MTPNGMAAWPEGVIARCGTVGGATVDIIDAVTPCSPRTQGKYEDHTLSATCTAAGCDWPGNLYEARTTEHRLWSEEETDSYYLERLTELRDSAAEHATKCRWLPKPDGGAR